MKGQDDNLSRLRTAVFLVAGALILSACSKKDESSDSTPTPPPAEIMYQATNVPTTTSLGNAAELLLAVDVEVVELSEEELPLPPHAVNVAVAVRNTSR